MTAKKHRLSVEGLFQERIIGRTKLADIELDDAVKPTNAHNALAKVVVDGREIKIVRDNMPATNFHASRGEFLLDRQHNTK